MIACSSFLCAYFALWWVAAAPPPKTLQRSSQHLESRVSMHYAAFQHACALLWKIPGLWSKGLPGFHFWGQLTKPLIHKGTYMYSYGFALVGDGFHFPNFETHRFACSSEFTNITIEHQHFWCCFQLSQLISVSKIVCLFCNVQQNSTTFQKRTG